MDIQRRHRERASHQFSDDLQTQASTLVDFIRSGDINPYLVQLQSEIGHPVANLVYPRSNNTPNETITQDLCSNPDYGLAYDDPIWGRMCYVPAGSSIIGSNTHYDDEKPERNLFIPAFHIQQNLATPSQYHQANGIGGLEVQHGQAVVSISWNNIQTMLGLPTSNDQYRAIRGGSWSHESSSCRASYRDRLTPDDRDVSLGFRVVLSPPQDFLPSSLPSFLTPFLLPSLPSASSLSYRLPLENEFERASRGWDGRIYPWGNDWIQDRAERLSKPSPWGIYGLCGEVWQWCQEEYVKNRTNPMCQCEN